MEQIAKEIANYYKDKCILLWTENCIDHSDDEEYGISEYIHYILDHGSAIFSENVKNKTFDFEIRIDISEGDEDDDEEIRIYSKKDLTEVCKLLHKNIIFEQWKN